MITNNICVFEGVRLSNPNKILSPTKIITKLQLAKYYAEISEFILPYLVYRPIVLVRCAGGFKDKPCFFQKHFNPSFSGSIFPIPILEQETGEESQYLTIRNKKGLLSLVQFDVLEFHPWGCSKKNPEKPDRIIFDLDPDPSLKWKEVIKAAFIVREELGELGLDCLVKTSGGKGLHVVVPVKPQYTWEKIKSFSHSFATDISNKYPKLFTEKLNKIHRKNKIFIDYLRNARGATAVAPYSTRALEGAPISMPISWEKLPSIKSSQEFTISNIYKKLARMDANPWGKYEKGQSLKVLKFPQKD